MIEVLNNINGHRTYHNNIHEFLCGGIKMNGSTLAKNLVYDLAAYLEYQKDLNGGEIVFFEYEIRDAGTEYADEISD